ncbi:hypothetical protein AB0H43_20030 [Hamadaea sp. NPDC050747]|uniref:hypothetical protein n=1 Tax=Hamadaea sp. NPDC050747 TaxID=3155789 RepID=UPI0034072DA7
MASHGVRRSVDRRTFVRIERSGGTPGVDRLVALPAATAPTGTQQELSGVVLVEDEPPINYSFTGRAVASVLGRWLAHRLFFRGGWTVHVEAPDRDPVKIRCPNRSAADALAHRLVEDLTNRGLAALDDLR